MPPPDRTVAAVLELGRPGALGALRRVETWERLLTAAGARVTQVQLVRECRPQPWELPGAFVDRVRHKALALETLAWSRRQAARQLVELAPALMVCTTARSYHPRVVPFGTSLVLDYVDRLSENYRSRAQLASSALGRQALRRLGDRMAAVEQRPPHGAVLTAAGHADADALGAVWVPNLVTVPPVHAVRPDHDVLFLGTLDYAPNVDALRRLAAAWPQVRRHRPQATVLVAGARPTKDVRDLLEAHHWSLAADFPELSSVCRRARVAVAPVAVSTGVQNKVLETAAHGLAQVVHPSVLQGLGPDFPARVADGPTELARALLDLLGDDDGTAALGRCARSHVQAHYTVEAWTPWCRGLLQGAGAVRRDEAPAAAG